MATLPVPGDGDVRLAYQVARELIDDDRERYRQIAVSVQNRVVILTGRANAATRDAAGGIARHSIGVADVCNLIRIPDAVMTDGTTRTGAGQPAPSERAHFDRIVAPLAGEAARWDRRRPVTASGIRALAVSAVTLGVTWAALLIVTVAYGWRAGLAGAVVVAMAMAAVHARELRRRVGARRSARPGRGAPPPDDGSRANTA